MSIREDIRQRIDAVYPMDVPQADAMSHPLDSAWLSSLETPAPDMVSHPPHYTAGGIECIDAIRAALTPEEFRGYCKGNMVKYLWRERHKGGNESVQKALWYGAEMLK